MKDEQWMFKKNSKNWNWFNTSNHREQQSESIQMTRYTTRKVDHKSGATHNQQYTGYTASSLRKGSDT